MLKCYSLAKNGVTKLSKNFRVREFRCRDGSDVIFVDTDLVDVLQKIRDHFGVAITINSAYRTPTYNKKVGGSTYSQHQYGTAADIVVKDVKPSEVAAYAESIMPNYGGVGRYATFTHVDVRPDKSRWNG